MVDVRGLERQETGTLHPSLSRSISPASAGIQSKCFFRRTEPFKYKEGGKQVFAESEFGVCKYSKNLMMAYLKDLYSKYNSTITRMY
ncbi:hypothetical protein Bca4012_032127 [Brassica carinata]